jgi:D-arabinose 1-dehydrogenase-like Zn-dependent alcohol dehydrogenase
MGGARVILATATSNEAMSAVADGLGVDGKLLVVGATADPIEVTPLQLIGRRASVAGWLSGTAADSGDTMRFSVLAGVRAMVETLPLERGPEGYARMMRGEARFRVVLVPADGGGDAGPSAGEPSAVRVGG